MFVPLAIGSGEHCVKVRERRVDEPVAVAAMLVGRAACPR